MKRKSRCAFLFFALFLTGCCPIAKIETQIAEKDSKALIQEQGDYEKPEEIEKIYKELYENIAEGNTPDSLELVKRMVNSLGENGYVAVDSENQINMTKAERVIQFCEQVDAKRESELTIIVVSYSDGFTKYDLKTKAGNVDVAREYYQYKKGCLKRTSATTYSAYAWKYTKEGYLFFEEYHMPGFDGPSGHTALRVQPLDEKCRELNRQYMLPIGYGLNDLFLSDWNEENFGDVNFYDLFDVFYSKVYGQTMPYVADANLGVGAIYQIPKVEFEKVIMSYFNISSEVLQSKTTYLPEEKSYEYRPRGLEDCEPPEVPYPEVVSYVENNDGTITLTVHVVYPYTNVSKVYAHEVVVRPMDGGGVQYVSNRIIPSKENYEETWHVDRLSEEEWEETYQESAYWFIPQASDCLISEEEKKHLQSTVLSTAELVKENYKDVIIADAPNYSSGVSEFTNEQRKDVVEQLGRSGLVSVEEDTAMQNHEAIEAFYADYLAGRDSMVTVFEVHRDGLIGAVTFIYRKGQLQTYYIGVRWKEGGEPEIQGTSVSNVVEIKLTEKGYFIYAYEYVIAHASLRQYWRIKPLPEDCRELTEKYISGLSYVNYNVLVTNWDSNNVEDILMPCMYEDIYRIYTGENLKTEDWKIPGEEYEKIMTTYFPVSVKQLREHCGYDEGSNSYEYEMIYASPYPPFGEVVDYTENADGTITLIVDGVWPDYNSDLAFRNTVVVQPFEDGTFRYLSNSVEQIELELPPIARTKG